MSSAVLQVGASEHRFEQQRSEQHPSEQHRSEQPDEHVEQLALHEGWTAGVRRATAPQRPVEKAPVCGGCREREARYGFRADEDDPAAERPRTLCFSCFRIEISRRQAVAARLAQGWNAEQAALPLEETLQQLTRRRRRAQIAARHALGL
jgi:hypothetical protein